MADAGTGLSTGLGIAGAVAGATGVGLPVTLGIAALQAGLGTFQYLNAIKQAKNNTRPFYSIDPAYQNNINLLTNNLGLPSSALDLFYKNIGQNTSNGINAILANGGNGNQIAGVLGNQNQNYEKLAIDDTLQRKQDLAGIIAARLQLAEQRDKAFQINQYAPYADRAAAISNQKAAGIQNIFGGLNSVSGGLANNAISKLGQPNNTGAKYGSIGSVSTISTPNSGVNTNQIAMNLYQQWLQQRQQPLYNGMPNTQLSLPMNNFTNYNYPLPLNLGN